MRLALRGRRNMDGRSEAITNIDELAAVRGQARRVVLKASFLAVLLEVLVLVL